MTPQRGTRETIGRVQGVIVVFSHRLYSSSLLGLPYRSLNMSPKKELLWSL